MLESIIAGVLSSILGDYVDGLEKENLKLNISGGHVVLRNLQLKKECLADLQLPVEVRAGFLGCVKLEIPWSSLSSKPTVARVEDVFLVARPTQPGEYNPELVRLKVQQTKKRRLQVAELLAPDPTKPEKEKPSDEDTVVIEETEFGKDMSYTQRLVQTIIDNIEVEVANVHLRYEDNISKPGQKFALGATLESFSLCSCDKNWKKAFQKSAQQQLVYKLTEMKNLAMYWNSDPTFLKYKTTAELGALMRGGIYRKGNVPKMNHYVLHPLCGLLKVQLNKKKVDLDIPKIISNAMFEKIALALQESQFQDIMSMANYFAYYIRGASYHQFRPDTTVRPTEDSSSWWTFAIRAKMADVKKKRRQWQWNRLAQYKQDRLLYMNLWKNKLVKKKNVSADTLSQLESLESALDYDQIILFRELAAAMVKKDVKEGKAQEGGGGWFGWVSWGKKDENVAVHNPTKEEWRELYAIVKLGKKDSDEEKDDKSPEDYVKVTSKFRLEECQLELIQSCKLPSERAKNRVLCAGFKGLDVDFLQRPTSQVVSMDVQAVSVDDFHTLRDLDEVVEMVSKNDHSEIDSDTFFSAKFEMNPLDHKADIRLCMTALQSLNIMFGRSIIDKLAKFFTNDNDASQLKLAANDTFDNLKKEGEMQIKYAMDNRKKIDIQLDVIAPNVLVPASFQDPDAPLVVVELGTLSIRSDLDSREQAVQKKAANGKEEATLTENYFYDKYSVSLSRMHAFVTTVSEDYESVSDTRHMDLVEKFDINVDLFHCSVASQDLAQIKVEGNLPALVARVSPEKIGKVFAVVQAVTATPDKRLVITDVTEEEARREAEEAAARETGEGEAAEEIALQQDPSTLIEKKQLQASLVFGKVELVLHGAVDLDSKKDSELIITRLTGLGAQYLKTSHQMTAELAIHGFSIEDKIQQYGEQCKYILTSQSEDGSDQKLVEIKARIVPKNSPQFNLVENEVDAKFGTLDLTVNRETMVAAIRYSTLCMEQLQSANEYSKDNKAAKEEAKRLKMIEEGSKPALPAPVVEKAITILLQAGLELSRVSVTLIKGGEKYMFASLQNSMISAEIRSNNEMNVNGTLGNVGVEDLTPGTLWPHIIQIDGDHVVDFWFETINPTGDSVTEGGGQILITLQVSTVRFVFLNRFVKGITDYLSEFSQMQALIQSTAKAAKEAAKATAKELNKVLIMDVTVANPCVIVPVSSASQNYIIGNLGDITVNNRVEPLGVDLALLDYIQVDITAINLKTVEKEALVPEKPVIKDTNITLRVERPILPKGSPLEEVAKRPQLLLDCTVSDIATAIAESQLEIVLAVLGGNLRELPEGSAEAERLKKKLIEAGRIEEPGEDEENAPEELEDEESKSTEEVKEEAEMTESVANATKFQVSLSLSEISLELLEGEGIDEEKKNLSLVRFFLSGLSANATIANNDSLDASVHLKTVGLQDTRALSENVHTNLLAPLEPAPEHLLMLSYSKNPVGDQNIVVSMDSPKITLIPDVLWALKDLGLRCANVATKSLQNLNEEKGEEEKAKEMEEKEEKKEKKKEEKEKLRQSRKSIDDADGAPQGGKIRLKFDLVSPSVWLLEDAKKADCRAVVMQQTIGLEFYMSEAGRQSADFHIKDIHVFKCKVKGEGGDDSTLVPILSPFNLGVNYSLAPDTLMSIILDVEKIRITLSYSDFKLVMALKDNWMDAIGAGEKEGEDRQIEGAPSGEQIEGEGKEDDNAALALVKARSKEAAKEASQNLQQAERKISKLEEHLKLICAGIDLLLLNDCYDGASAEAANAPLLALHIKEVTATAANWSSHLEATADVACLAAHYFNTVRNVPEPMIEPWDVTALVQRPVDAGVSVTLEATKVLNVNVTKAFVETVLSALEQWQEDFSGTTENRKLQPPVSISNETGLNLQYWATGNKKAKKHSLEANSEQALQIEEFEAGVRQSMAAFKLSIGTGDAGGKAVEGIDDFSVPKEMDRALSIQLEGDEFLPLHNLHFSRSGYALLSVSARSPDLRLMYSVSFKNSCRIVRLGSDVVIRNETLVPLSVQLDHKHLPTLEMEPIEPGEGRCIPVLYAGSAIAKVKPSCFPYAWSSASISCARISKATVPSYFECASRDLKDKTAQKWIYSVDLSGHRAKEVGTYGESQEAVLTFRAPLTLENRLPAAIRYQIRDAEGVKLTGGALNAGSDIEIYQLLAGHRPVVQFSIDGVHWTQPKKLDGSETFHMPVLLQQQPTQIKLKAAPTPKKAMGRTASMKSMNAKGRGNGNGKGRSKKNRQNSKEEASVEADVRCQTLRLSAQNETDSASKARRCSLFVTHWLYNRTGAPLWFKPEKSRLQSVVSAAQLRNSSQEFHDIHGIESRSKAMSAKSGSLARLPDASELDALSREDNDICDPLMFSSDHISIKNRESKWSDAFPLDTTNGVASATEVDSGLREPRTFQYSVTSARGPGKYWRTNMVTFMPYYVLINKSSRRLEIKQQRTEGVVSFDADQQADFAWPCPSRPRHLQLRFMDEESNWSNPFMIDAPNNHQVQVGKPDGRVELVRLKILATPSSICVLFLQSEEGYADYCIDNRSSTPVVVGQHETKESIRVAAGSKHPYAWQVPLMEKKKLYLSVPHTRVSEVILLEKLKKFPKLHWHGSDGEEHSLSVEVVAAGLTRVLVLEDVTWSLEEEVREKEKKKMALVPKVSDVPVDTTGNKPDGHYDDEEEEVGPNTVEKALMTVAMKLKGVGVSVIDQAPQELIYLSMMDIGLLFSATNTTQSIELAVGGLQIDNQLLTTPYPILLFSPKVEGQPFLHISVLRSTKYSGILYCPYFAFKIQTMDIRVDELCLLRVLNFIDLITSFLATRQQEKKELALFRVPSSFHVPEEDIATKSDLMLYFDMLHINPIQVNVSFLTVGGGADDLAGNSILEKTLRAGGFLANIESAPLRLNGLILEHPFCSQSELVGRIVQHYTVQALRETYKILGSADVLGSPVLLVNSLGTGVYDFFHEPAEGIVSSPRDFATGVAKGTTSLIKNSVFAVFNSTSKITGTISRAATTISMDKDWQRERAKKERHKPQNIRQGLLKGFQNLGAGVVSGVTGVVSQPVRGLGSDGGAGFVQGVGKGVSGLVLRPVVGVVDLITDTTEGIKNSAKAEEGERNKARAPRYIGPNKVITLYSEAKSKGQLVLRTVEKGRFEHEYFEEWKHLGEAKKTILFSNKSCFVLEEAPSDESGYTVKLAVPFSAISATKIDPEGLVVQTTARAVLVELPKDLIEPMAAKIKERTRSSGAQQSGAAFQRYHSFEDPALAEKFTKKKLTITAEDVAVVEGAEAHSPIVATRLDSASSINSDDIDEQEGKKSHISPADKKKKKEIDPREEKRKEQQRQSQSSQGTPGKRSSAQRQTESQRRQAEQKQKARQSGAAAPATMDENTPLVPSSQRQGQPQRRRRPPPQDDGCCCVVM